MAAGDLGWSEERQMILKCAIQRARKANPCANHSRRPTTPHPGSIAIARRCIYVRVGMGRGQARCQAAVKYERRGI